MKPYLSSIEVARFLDVSPQTVSAWLKSGKLPAPRKSGLAYRHRLDDVLRSVVEHSLTCSDEVFEQAVARVAQLQAT